MPGLTDFLSRIQTDHAFYCQFLTSPQQTLAAYDLSAEEHTALIEPGAQLSALLKQTLHFFIRTIHYLALEPEDVEFNLAASIARPEVQQAIGQIRSATDRNERLVAVSALIQHLE
jgi:hypothetical protein